MSESGNIDSKSSKPSVRGKRLALSTSGDSGKKSSGSRPFRGDRPAVVVEVKRNRSKASDKPVFQTEGAKHGSEQLPKAGRKGKTDVSSERLTDSKNRLKSGSKSLTDTESTARRNALKEAQDREAKKAELDKLFSKLHGDVGQDTALDSERTEAEGGFAGQTDSQVETAKGESPERLEKSESDPKKDVEAKESVADVQKAKDVTENQQDEKSAPKSKDELDATDSAGRMRNRKPGGKSAAEGGRTGDAKSKESAGKKKDSQKSASRKGGASPGKQKQPHKSSSRSRRERRRSKLTVTSALNDDGSQQRSHSLAALRRKREKEKRAAQEMPREKISREVVLPETITIQELAHRMSERAVDVIKLLMSQGQMLKINDLIDADMAELIAEEMGHTVKRVSEADVEEGLFSIEDDEGALLPRPPVVTIMGHVDHGKTSLLDALRKSKIASGEAGGITQHIGAYQVERNGQKITFIDTPGHAAFTKMRARGAKVTDIVVLVVAADDGVMPQTEEAIAHAKAADVPLILAINKIDKPSIDMDRIRTELIQKEVLVESKGGDVLEVEVSAKQGTNLDKLLDAILLQAELLELKANPDRMAEGVVIEAKLDKGRGNVATVLVQKGKLRVGDIIIGGTEWGRVRALIDDLGKSIKEAEPSKPVEVLGFQGTPDAGDLIAAVKDESRARDVSEFRTRKRQTVKQASGVRGTLEQMMLGLKAEGKNEFVLIVKGDVQGSVEAINGALDELGTDEVQARIIHSAVGGVTEADVTLASASNAVILGFNVRANQQAREAAKTSGVEIRYYGVIYDLVDDVKSAMSGLLTPDRKETLLGNAEILEIFNISKVGKIAGCRVSEGLVRKGEHVRLIRDNIVIHEGELGTLKHFKDEVKEARAGQECGMNFDTYQDMRPGDVIECYSVQEIARSL